MSIETYEKCKSIVIETLINYSNEINKPLEKVDENTRLIGSTSFFDSSDLIQIIVEIEDKINFEFNSDITLTDEKAMSKSTSPFINIGTLLKFIIENLK
jgi:acyl carrier protein